MWELPPRGQCKLNFDSSIRDNKTSIGFAVRNDIGTLIWLVLFRLLFYQCLKQRLGAMEDPYVGFVMIMVRELCRKVMLKTSVPLFLSVTGYGCHPLLSDAGLLVSSFMQSHVQHTWIERNMCANFMASDGFSLVSKFVQNENFPHQLIYLAMRYIFGCKYVQ